MDAESKAPIPSFQVVKGFYVGSMDEPRWLHDNATEHVEGAFNATISEPYDNWLIRVEADGYYSSVSRRLKPGEANVQLEFNLTRGSGPRGIVLSPDGVPLEGALVVLAKPNRKVEIRDGLSVRSRSNSQRRTGADGAFKFTAADREYCVVVVHALGTAIVSKNVLAAQPEVRLEPWGRVSGVVRVRDEDKADETVSIDVSRAIEQFQIHYRYTAKTDTRGEFAVERVAPGRASLRHLKVVNRSTTGVVTMTGGPAQVINVESGSTATTTVEVSSAAGNP